MAPDASIQTPAIDFLFSLDLRPSVKGVIPTAIVRSFFISPQHTTPHSTIPIPFVLRIAKDNPDKHLPPKLQISQSRRESLTARGFSRRRFLVLTLPHTQADKPK